MAKVRTLKVFTAPIGFHDALVAAPSRAAALRAWGSEHDLFARGMASEVSDPALAAEPLAHPGEVIRRPRAGVGGGEGASSSITAEGVAGRRARPKRHADRPPKPSRRALDAAEAALKSAKERHLAQDAAAKARIEEAQRARRAGQEQAKAEQQRLEENRERERHRYGKALERWRATAAHGAAG